MHIRLIDGRALGLHLHHGLQLRPSAEDPTITMVSLMLELIKKFLQTSGVDITVFLWGESAPWRKKIAPGYGAADSAMLNDYLGQEAILQNVLRSLPVIQLWSTEGEGCDLAWGLSKQLSRQGHLTTIVSPCVSLLQAVDSRVEWQSLRTPKQVVSLESFAVASGGFPTPAAVGPIIALIGDVSKGIEGTQGLTLKNAQYLISKYKTIEYLLYSTRDFLRFSQEPQFAQALMVEDTQSRIALNIKLIDLSRAHPLDSGECKLVQGEGDYSRVAEVLRSSPSFVPSSVAHTWGQIVFKRMGAGEAQAVLRAVSKLSDSWPVKNKR